MFDAIFKWCQGRHTAFALFFTVMGTLMAWFHRLGPEYVALVTAVQGLILAHSYKQDRYPDQPQGGPPQC